MHLKNKIPYFFIGLFILLGCKDQSAYKYGPDYNPIRQHLRIPIIESNWKTPSRPDDLYQIWGLGKELEKVGGHHSLKLVILKGADIVSEEDTYLYHTNGKLKYTLTYLYTYEAPSEWYHWKCKLVDEENNTDNDYFPIEKADSLLNAWRVTPR